MRVETARRNNLVSYAIRDIVLEAKGIEKQGTSMVYMNIGDPGPFGFRPPQHILDTIIESFNKNYFGYAPSEGDPELVTEIAKFEGVQENDVFVTTGLTEGIDFLFHTLLDPGHNIILPSPTYPLYITKGRVYSGNERYYDCDNYWEPHIDSLRKNINEFTSALVLINPNNPTGAVYSRRRVQDIIDVAGEFRLPIISDNAYEMMVFDGECPDIRKLHKDVPLIIGGSLSKNFMFPGARVGWLAFHGEGMDKLRNSTQKLCNQRLSVNWQMQRGAIAALRKGKDHIKPFNEELRKRRDFIVKRINEIEGLSLSPPKGAFYAFPKVDSNKWKSDWEFCRELLKYGVVTVPGSGFSPVLNELYFRIVLLPHPEKIDQAFNNIEKMMKDNKA